MSTNIRPYNNRAYNLARSNPIAAAKTLYNVGKLAYNAYNKIAPVARSYLSRPSTSTVAVRPRVRTVTSTRYVGPRVINRQVRRLRTYKKKSNQVNRLVGTTRNNVYTKTSKRMRRGNKGKLSLQQRLQSGMSLPNTTFAKLHWRGSQLIYFVTARKDQPPTSGPVSFVNTRSFCLNDLSSPPSFDGSPEFLHHVNYSRMWEQLYREYQVFGAKARFKLNPALLPTGLSTAQRVSNDSTVAYVPENAQPGYWYVRAYYTRRGSRHNSNPDTVGHPIARFTSSQLDDKSEEYWGSLREFLSDPTVTYVKDKTNIRTKIHVHSSSKINGNQPPVELVPLSEKTTSTSYEIETSTKPVTLTVNFSAKKHFEDKNPMTNGPWRDWDTQLDLDEQFNVRIGYIGFDATGSVAYHCPVDRTLGRFVEVDISYFVGFRDPLISPHDEPAFPDGRMALNQPEPYEEPPEELMSLLNL